MAIALLLSSLLFVSCADQRKPPSMDPAFGGYISAFTNGVISTKGPIVIRLQNPIKSSILNNPNALKDLFDFTPNISGEVRTEGLRTIVFIPDERLVQNKEHQVSFALGQTAEVPLELDEFVFIFRTIEQAIEMDPLGLAPYDDQVMERQVITGLLRTADHVEEDLFKKVLIASQEDHDLKVKWSHDRNGTEHRFTIDSVERKELMTTVLIEVSGKIIGTDDSYDLVQEIPALGDFRVIATKVIQQPDQYASISFSDPINSSQDLEGIIDLLGVGSITTEVSSNELRVYPSTRKRGEMALIVSAGLENILGYKLGEEVTIDLVFEEVKPSVRVVGNGTILPSTDGTLFPFETVNLAAVDVSVIRIFEDNVVQFLQTNDMNGSNQIKRVGRLVKRKTVRLDKSGEKDLGRWNRFYLDLADLTKGEQGAIYRVELDFKKKYSLYSCGETEDIKTDNQEIQDNWDTYEEIESSNWDYYDTYYYDWNYGNYNYRERNDPCSDSYYIRRRAVGNNFMASDIGLIVKGGNDKSLFIAVNDLISTDPIDGANIKIYNYQNQLMSTVQSDSKGLASLDMTREKPFLLVAEYGGHKGYLKLDDGSSMNLSKFDVHGHQMQKGMKGFIYGDRGVWRPGDSLYLAFILEDAQELIPDHHPVTMELIDPRGRRVAKTLHKASDHGFYDLRTATDHKAPTGAWRVDVKIGNAKFSKTVRIETVKPNRLKIELDLGEDMLTQENERIKGTLKTKWLHGAIAKDLNAKIELSLQQQNTNFERFSEYEFDDPVRRFEQNELLIFDGTVDDQGVAKIDAALHINDQAPGLLRANFVCRVFEKSGDHSIDRHSVTYSPYSNYVGIKLPKGDRSRGMLLTDTTHKVKIVTLSEKGEPVQRDSIYVAIYKISWRWWWHGGSDNLEKYFGRNAQTLISEQWISTNSSGEGTFKFEVKYPDWGRYLVRAKDELGGHATGRTVYIDWPGWAGRAQRSNPEAEQMLVLSVDKEKYNVGQTAELFIPTGEEGRALLTIENGSRVIKADWIIAKKGGVKYQLPLTSEMAPNVYAHVSYVQPHGNTKNSLPIRMFGIVPIMVDDPNTKLQPTLAMPSEIRPEESVKITVAEKEGRPMSYTIAMVDEGLLDLTRFGTPDPWNHFFAKEALGVKTWDLYDDVIGAFGGKLTPLLALGGDGQAPQKGKARAERFKPMVRYIGPFNLKAGQKAEHVIQIPNYIGSVRTMVIAGNGKAYGNTEKTTPVKKPLMLLATLPRVVGPGETVRLPVTVFAMDKKIKKVNVKVTINEMFGTIGGSSKTINFERTGDEIVEFDLKAAEMLGPAVVIIEASCGSEKAYQKIEIEVRNANPPMISTIEEFVDAGKTVEVGYSPIGMAGTNKGTLEISSIPPIDLGRRLQYLLSYPHGCVEQTTSKAFPQLFVSDVIELDETSKKRAQQNVKEAIKRLVGFQRSNGGLSYWSGRDNISDWGTTYAGHFMLEAENKAYTIPSSFKSSWIQYQKNNARSWRRSGRKGHRWGEVAQAYRLYTLALANSPELGAMNRLRTEKDILPNAKWRLAAAYQLAGKPEVAQAIIKELTTTVEEYMELSYTFGSTERDIAMIVETLTLMGEDLLAAPIVQALSQKLSSNRWLNTQATAYALLAISKYAGATLDQGVRYSVSINGSNMNTHFSQKPIALLPLNIKSTEGGTIKVNNENSTPLYVRILLEGTPVSGQEKAQQKQLNMNVSYHLYDGTPLSEYEIEQGTDLYALVTITHPGIMDDYKEMALTQIFPSGWEIRNTRMDALVNDEDRTRPTYQDIRDDRVLTYFDLRRNHKATFKIRLNATYLGEFYLPSVSCEAMYSNKIRASTAGKWVRVVKPDGEVKAFRTNRNN